MKEITKITDLVQDDHNANRGSVRGHAMIEESLQRCGTGRSVLVDRNGKLIAGNKTQECAVAAGFEDVILVKSDGKKLVVVQRTDLDLDTDEQARQLAYADNRASEVSMNWDPNVVIVDWQDPGLDMSWLFRADDIQRIEGIEDLLPEDIKGTSDDKGEGSGSGFELTIGFHTREDQEAAARELRDQGYNVLRGR